MHPAGFLRRCAIALFAVTTWLACSSSEPSAPGALSDGCSINSDCNSPLVCAFRKCHNACTSTRDCGTGLRCVESDKPYHVCQLDTEKRCAYNSDCPGSQLCAVDAQCRDQCLGDRDCVEAQVCASGSCADPPELTPSGRLPVSTPDAASDAPATGQPCRYNSECAPPLVCRANFCAFECLADVDCPSGQGCVANRCSRSGIAPDGGTSMPCSYNSDCPMGLTCRPSGVCGFECISDQDCTGGLHCLQHHCGTAGPDAGSEGGGVCVPKTCAEQGKDCGITTDGCGSILQCSPSCPLGKTCGGAGNANICSPGTCTPATCASLGKTCGLVSDGCSFILNCGTCISPSTCGGGGVANVCGCKSDPVAACAGKTCGEVIDNCGNTVHCGTCALPTTCGGGGTANVCGCTKATCASLGKNCGTVPDGCGGTLDCGACASGSCGGGGPNVCGTNPCTPKACVPNQDCGVISDGCGTTLTCGSCIAPNTCGGGGTPNVCGCVKTTCVAQGKDCGSIPDGCGGTLICGSCAEPSTCGGSGTPNVCGCTPTTCAALGKDCGVVSNGCGGLLSCGSCTLPNTCGGSGIPNVCGSSSGAPSCRGSVVTCGNVNEDCCVSPKVAGGSFNRSNDGAYPATVSDFRLDKYEVTVGRFRSFVEAGKGTQVSPPTAWTGAAPGVPTSGWNPDWNGSLPVDTAALKSALKSFGGSTWTDAPASTDNLPINGVTWYESFAFCAWDDAWLVTEAEWNYAAAGGADQRVLPWSTDPMAPEDCMHANDACSGAILPVGSKSTPGDGKWGQADLLGNILERVMDTFATPYPLVTCSDCVFTAAGQHAAVRGGAYGDFYGSHWSTLTRTDDSVGKGGRDSRVGFRCARAP